LKQGQLQVKEFVYRPGYGVAAQVDGVQVVIGNISWLRENSIQPVSELERAAEKLDLLGIGSVRCAVNGREIALLGVEDPLRQDAEKLVAGLKAAGMKPFMLSGDREATAEAIARRLGGMPVIAEVLPEQKDQVIDQLQQGNQRVAMVGDGVNDAPALVRADVGIALGSGTDVSIASADIVLMSNELDKVRLASALSRRTLRTIRQNIGLSIAYNLIMIPLAMSAFVTPLVAAISMPISSLLVIGNAARIRTLFRGVR
ncbi:MAG: HAD-IC family P-type ATPase, partial [Sedimenticola sp.]|nr:HAD-IC family P-type ATPase [Sedimenticola sp.]